MYYVVSEDHNSVAAQPTTSDWVTVKGCKKCCVSSALGGTDDGIFWNDREEDGNVRSECEEDE